MIATTGMVWTVKYHNSARSHAVKPITNHELTTFPRIEEDIAPLDPIVIFHHPKIPGLYNPLWIHKKKSFEMIQY